MAKPTTASWTKLVLYVGDDASPQTFAKRVCGLTTKSFAINAQTADTVVPDCDNPDQPAWIERIIRSLSSSFSGAGVLAVENRDFFADWALAGTILDCRIAIESATPIHFAGRFALTKFEITGNEADGKLNASMAFDSDGPVTRVSGAATP